ncbi:MAG: hypothetical protein GY868_19875 [Deltaproteobacteria bacterium]|nr:hypothetical protein [Deltaproteobacteria bacterium]
MTYSELLHLGNTALAQNTIEESTAEYADKQFQAGLIMLENRKTGEAFLAFKQALQLRPNDAVFRSYFGLALAMVDKRAVEPLSFCEEAVKKDYFRPELFLNLGKVHLLKGERSKALQTFYKGLGVEKRHKGLRLEIRKMGVRKQPVFPSLGRENVINILMGRLLRKMGTR